MKILAAFLAAVPIVSFAQHSGGHQDHTAPPSNAPEVRPKPVEPATKAAYRSAFEGYRAFDPNEPLKDWKRANDDVREAGGHLGIFRAASGKAHHPGSRGDKQ